MILEKYNKKPSQSLQGEMPFLLQTLHTSCYQIIKLKEIENLLTPLQIKNLPSFVNSLQILRFILISAWLARLVA